MIIQIELNWNYHDVGVGVSQNGLDTHCRRCHLFGFCLEFSITTTTVNVTIKIFHHLVSPISTYFACSSWWPFINLPSKDLVEEYTQTVCTLFGIQPQYRNLLCFVFWRAFMFSVQRKFTPQLSHWQESFNEMFRNAWGFFLKDMNCGECLRGGFWWLTGCAVREGKTKEKEARTSYWKDTRGNNSTIFINNLKVDGNIFQFYKQSEFNQDVITLTSFH